MHRKNILLQLIPAQGILPLYYHRDAGVSIEVLRILYKAGIRAVEYTNRGEAALENFKQMRAICDKELPGMYLGAGTIKNESAALHFIAAGADFIISPGVVNDVARVADNNKLLWVPGCLSTSEIISAENMGAKFIKLFPGNILGPGYVSAIKDIFPDILFMPTGGVEVDENNLRDWFRSGVCAVGMGSKLLSKNLLEEKNYTKIEELIKEAIDLVRLVK